MVLNSFLSLEVWTLIFKLPYRHYRYVCEKAQGVFWCWWCVLYNTSSKNYGLSSWSRSPSQRKAKAKNVKDWMKGMSILKQKLEVKI